MQSRGTLEAPMREDGSVLTPRAAPEVACETNTCVAVPSAAVTAMCGVGVTGLGASPFFFFQVEVCAFLFTLLQTVTDSTSPSWAIVGELLPVILINVSKFEVAFADICVSQSWAASGSGSCGKLSVHDVFWDASVLHTMRVPEPAQPSFAKEKVHAKAVCLFQHSNVAHFVAPCDAEDSAETSEVEAFQTFLLPGVDGPSLAAI